ncbi:MAG: trypsin-like peptidase domain-containing protein [Spirochaetaceae bacterium]|jgi:S1-C subfamily serine protease|nr:trypsin-like peptidase domain-containing protein [Spirochaetaceae bacterium]
MKLYSRSHLVLFSGLSALITLVLLFALGFIENPFQKKYSGLVNNDEITQSREETAFHASESTAAQALSFDSADLQPYSSGEKENIAVYDLLNDAVVNITTEIQGYNWFLEPVPQDGGSGSGSIIDSSGLVLTNNHVISQAIKVYLNLADGTELEGHVIGSDPENDLAVIRFTPPPGISLKTIPFGDSANLKVGQKVLAIGNPFALERTLTVGIVSGLGRPIQTSRQHIIRDMIQTDASINPGNSGGPLLDSSGKMIGINTMIYSPSGGSVGIGFAVPINTAKRVVAELIKYGKVRRGWIDASLVQLFPRLVEYGRLPVSTGLLVSRTKRNGLAEKGGLKQGSDAVRYGSNVIYVGGDIITSVDGLKTESLADLYSALEDNKPGDLVDIEVFRNAKIVKLKITLADRDEVRNP